MRLDNIRAAATRQLEQAVAMKAQELRNEIVDNFVRPGSGRVYRKYNPKRTHQASAPGEGPAIDQARLAQAITAWMVRPGHWRVGIASSDGEKPHDPENSDGPTIGEVGLWLEFGTRKISPRPFVRPAVEKLRHRGSR